LKDFRKNNQDFDNNGAKSEQLSITQSELLQNIFY